MPSARVVRGKSVWSAASPKGTLGHLRSQPSVDNIVRGPAAAERQCNRLCEAASRGHAGSSASLMFQHVSRLCGKLAAEQARGHSGGTTAGLRCVRTASGVHGGRRCDARH